MKPYWSARGELTVVHGILLKSVVPSARNCKFWIRYTKGTREESSVENMQRLLFGGLVSAMKFKTCLKIAKFAPSTDSSGLSHSCQHPLLNIPGR